jgi:YVTN family beta-propeller protein
VNFVRNAHGSFAYVTVGGLNEVKVYRLADFVQTATIHVGSLPHGIWPSGDGTRVYVGLENADELIAIDTLRNKIVATIPIGQAAQAVNYVPNAVPHGTGRLGLQPLGTAGTAVHLWLAASESASPHSPRTSVTLFDQGITQVLQAAANG